MTKDPRQNKSRPEYWSHKLRGEVKYVSTQKNELAIKEFAEDIAQHIELVADKETNLSEMIKETHFDVNRLEMDISELKKELADVKLQNYLTWGGIALLVILAFTR